MFNNLSAEGLEKATKLAKETNEQFEAFARVEVHSAGLEDELDLYVRTTPDLIPAYGLKAGPNLLFERAMHVAHQFGGWCLQIEVDALPVENNWLISTEKITATAYSEWVIGGHYMGNSVLDNRVKSHINGNALYHAGDHQFIAFVSDIWLPRIMGRRSSDPGLAYDCWWATEADRSNSVLKNKSWELWKLYVPRFRYLPFIVNINIGIEGSHEYLEKLNVLRSSGQTPIFIHGAACNDIRRELAAREDSTYEQVIQDHTAGEAAPIVRHPQFTEKPEVTIEKSLGALVAPSDTLPYREFSIGQGESQITLSNVGTTFDIQVKLGDAPKINASTDFGSVSIGKISFDEESGFYDICFNFTNSLSVRKLRFAFENSEAEGAPLRIASTFEFARSNYYEQDKVLAPIVQDVPVEAQDTLINNNAVHALEADYASGDDIWQSWFLPEQSPKLIGKWSTPEEHLIWACEAHVGIIFTNDDLDRSADTAYLNFAGRFALANGKVTLRLGNDIILHKEYFGQEFSETIEIATDQLTDAFNKFDIHFDTVPVGEGGPLGRTLFGAISRCVLTRQAPEDLPTENLTGSAITRAWFLPQHQPRLQTGWSYPEGEHIWACEERAEVTFTGRDMNLDTDTSRFEFAGRFAGDSGKISVLLAGETIIVKEYATQTFHEEIEISTSLLNIAHNFLEFHFDTDVVKEAGESGRTLHGAISKCLMLT